MIQTRCPAGTRYRYNIDGELEVPDPASRAQAGDIDRHSVVVDPHAYPWRHTQWSGRPWHEAVIYELHVGALGGFDGVELHLAHLAGLGITAIELMPLAQFPGDRNWGYDGVLPYAPPGFLRDARTAQASDRQCPRSWALRHPRCGLQPLRPRWQLPAPLCQGLLP
nr:hypothetical protein GCM10020185_74060 [Pseudomonas brassicacearum subsp. brassicacearum]